MVRNVTERIQSQRSIVQLERLGALGEIAHGVSHNFNNILVGVLGYAQLIEMATSDPEVLRHSERIVSSALRAKELVERLNRSVRVRGGGELQPLSVNDVVQEAVDTARPRWKDEAESEGLAILVTTDLTDVPPARGSQEGLHDILVNLLFNAVDAMPQGGSVRIETDIADRTVRITVSDTGVGMDEETRRRVFEPFFTTKAEVGTGLGLSTVYGTMTRWGGRIEVASSPGEGTTFTILLPLWQGDRSGQPEEE